MSGEEEIAKRDEETLAQLGYKQEFKREFTPLEVFGVAFSCMGLFPSLASVLVYAIPNGGPLPWYGGGSWRPLLSSQPVCLLQS